jgi:hypothetical protein
VEYIFEERRKVEIGVFIQIVLSHASITVKYKVLHVAVLEGWNSNLGMVFCTGKHGSCTKIKNPVYPTIE